MECVPTWVLSNHAWLNLTSLLHTQINKTLFELLFWTWILLIYCLSDQKWDWKSLEFLHISQRDEAEQPDTVRQHVSCVLHQGESIFPDVSQFLLFHMLIWCCWHVITTYFNLCREHQWSWHPFNVVHCIYTIQRMLPYAAHLKMWSEQSYLNASWVHSHLYLTVLLIVHLHPRCLLMPGIKRATEPAHGVRMAEGIIYKIPTA